MKKFLTTAMLTLILLMGTFTNTEAKKILIGDSMESYSSGDYSYNFAWQQALAERDGLLSQIGATKRNLHRTAMVNDFGLFSQKTKKLYRESFLFWDCFL